MIVTSYETAMRAGYNFLSVFLKKCTMKGEDDYRPLFENFVQDLLSTVNKPEWPSSELLLSLLGRILVRLNFVVFVYNIPLTAIVVCGQGNVLKSCDSCLADERKVELKCFILYSMVAITQN